MICYSRTEFQEFVDRHGLWCWRECWIRGLGGWTLAFFFSPFFLHGQWDWQKKAFNIRRVQVHVEIGSKTELAKRGESAGVVGCGP